MTVPAVGSQITMSGLAKERKLNDYNASSGGIQGPIHMFDLIYGGNAAGSGENYPTNVRNFTPNPLGKPRVSVGDIKVNMGGEAPGNCQTNLQLYNSSGISNSNTVTAYVRDLDGLSWNSGNNTNFNDMDWRQVKQTGSSGVLEHYFERLASVWTTSGFIYFQAQGSTSTARLANGIYYLSFAGANSSGVYTCVGPGNESLKIKVTISDSGTVQENALGQ